MLDIPPKTTTRKYPLDQLAVGESFAIETDRESLRRVSVTIASSMLHEARKTGRRFTQRTSLEPCCVRVWRTA